ncbi:agmatine deiminase family protein [Mumia zhuanghuii]|nr:agmatine deiminase family protein [Mumia zhuanghuii]
MPSETAPQDRVWMAFPTAGYSLGETADDAEEARATWSAVAHAVSDFAPVTMVVDPEDVRDARRWLSVGIEVVEAPLNDAWMRDIGPTFVHDEHGAVTAVDWVFNGWGQQDWARWDHDARIAAVVVREAGVVRVGSSMVNEGGGIHVDGLGTVLVTETVQRDPQRNPGWSRSAVEDELARTIGATHVVWLPRGLTRDSERYGTRGHVDIVATFPSPGRVLVHDQRDAAHPDHPVSAEIRTALEEAVDARGLALEQVPLPAPQTLRDDEGWVDWSYVNHLVVNGGVIACAFGDPQDVEAAAVLRDEYPGREVVAVDARPLFARGGGIHCITQQQPAAVAGR